MRESEESWWSGHLVAGGLADDVDHGDHEALGGQRGPGINVHLLPRARALRPARWHVALQADLQVGRAGQCACERFKDRRDASTTPRRLQATHTSTLQVVRDGLPRPDTCTPCGKQTIVASAASGSSQVPSTPYFHYRSWRNACSAHLAAIVEELPQRHLAQHLQRARGRAPQHAHRRRRPGRVPVAARPEGVLLLLLLLLLGRCRCCCSCRCSRLCSGSRVRQGCPTCPSNMS